MKLLYSPSGAVFFAVADVNKSELLKLDKGLVDVLHNAIEKFERAVEDANKFAHDMGKLIQGR